MGVSPNQGPSYRPQHSRALIIRTLTKRTPNLKKQPYRFDLLQAIWSPRVSACVQVGGDGLEAGFRRTDLGTWCYLGQFQMGRYQVGNLTGGLYKSHIACLPF